MQPRHSRAMVSSHSTAGKSRWNRKVSSASNPVLGQARVPATGCGNTAGRRSVSCYVSGAALGSKGAIMDFFRRATTGVLATVAIASLTACNGGSSSVNPFAPSRGTVRFINGSPDAGTVDVAVGKANQPNFTGLVYAGTGFNASTNANAGISSYTPFNAPTQSIFIYQTGTST